MKTGVYVIEHRESGKKYVGSAGRSISQRWREHRCKLRKGTHHSRYLQSAWSKYGEDAFVFRIIEPCLPEHATGVEQVFIDWYKSADREFGYNILPIAGSCLGRKRTAETREKISAAQKGRKRSAEEVAKRAGKKHTAEHRAKISAALMGNKYNLGHKASAEVRAKMSAAQKLRLPVSAEGRAKMSAGQKGNKNALGRKHTAETRERMSAARKLRPPASAESRAKNSAAQKKRCAAKREEAECTARA